MVSEFGLQKDVILAGRVEHEEVQRHYSLMDVLVYPRISRRITELVTPLKPLEAMAMNKLVVGSNVGGIKELIRDGENGLLFESGNVISLVRALELPLDCPDGAAEIQRAGRLHVERFRNWLDICARYEDIFRAMKVSGGNRARSVAGAEST